jgi:hypothetical protein
MSEESLDIDSQLNKSTLVQGFDDGALIVFVSITLITIYILVYLIRSSVKKERRRQRQQARAELRATREEQRRTGQNSEEQVSNEPRVRPRDADADEM